MSFQAIAWAVRQKLPCTQKIVLVMLSDRHNGDTGRCDPSHERLAIDCGLTRRSVMDQIEKLSFAGYLRVIHRMDGPKKASNQYTLILSAGTQLVVNDVHYDSEPRSLGVVNHVPLVVNHVHQGSEPRSHKPVIEPVKNLNTNTRAEALVIIKPVLVIVKPDEVSKEVWDDFLTHRKAKHAKLTNTALAGIKREADKAGWTLENALTESCARGWTGFKADWVVERKPAAMTVNNRNTHKFAGAAAAIFNMDDSEVIDV